MRKIYQRSECAAADSGHWIYQCDQGKHDESSFDRVMEANSLSGFKRESEERIRKYKNR